MNQRRMLAALICLTLMPGISLATDLVDNLISVWKLDEANGDALDAHGLNKLTQGGTVGTATGKVYATARSFERTSVERFSIADNATLSCGSGVSVTMGAWVKLASDPGGGQFMMIMAKDDGVTNREYYLGWHGSSDKFAFQTWNAGSGGGAVSVETADTVTVGPWYFVQAGYDATTGKIWIRLNDSAQVTASQTLIFDSTADFRIGSNSNSTPQHGWNGEIGPAFFYKRYVSGGELRQHYNSTLGLAYDGYGVNVSHWLAKAAATPSIAGVPKVDVTQVAGQTATVATTPIDANVTKFGGGNGFFSNGRPEVNATHLNGNSQSLLDIKDFADNGYDPATDFTNSNIKAILDDTNAPYGAARFFSGNGWGPLVWRSVVSTVDSQTELRLVGSGPAVDQSVTGCTVIVRDDQDLDRMMIAEVTDYGASSETVRIEPVGGTFTIGVGDFLEFLPPTFNGDDRTDLLTVKGKTDSLPTAAAGTNGGLATLDANLNVQADIEAISDDTNAPYGAARFFTGNGWAPLIWRSVVTTVDSQTELKVVGSGPAVNQAVTGCTVVVRDDQDLDRMMIAEVTDYNASSETVKIAAVAGTFTIGIGDILEFLPPAQ
jgi:Concanavalin A-like lectin/glucanases superfamily